MEDQINKVILRARLQELTQLDLETTQKILEIKSQLGE